MTYKKEDEQTLRARIGDEAYEVTQNAATEMPFTGEYDLLFEKGIYVDIVSGEPLFLPSDKFNSGCGWPAFSKNPGGYCHIPGHLMHMEKNPS